MRLFRQSQSQDHSERRAYIPGPDGYAGKSGGRGGNVFGFSWIDFITS
jgi:hypothetical protein